MIAWAIETAVAVSLLIALVLVIRRPIAAAFGARAAYALWLAPAARAVIPPLPEAGAILPAASFANPVELVLVEGGSAASASLSVASVLIATWVIGAAGFIAVQLWRHHRFLSAALASGRPLDVPGIRYDVVASGRVDGPVATGLIHPLILVPEDFEKRFSPEQQRFALWHEQLHHRRGDIWASAAALLLTGLLWFNPLAHLGLGAFRRDMEAACDSRLLDDAGRSVAPAYAETILRCAARPVPRSLCALTSIDELKGRLTMLKLDHGAGRRLAGLLLAASISVAGLAIAQPAAAVQDKAEEPEKFVKRIEIIETRGDKDVVVRRGDGSDSAVRITNCEGEKFEAGSSGGTETRKENIKFFVCGKAGEKLLPALEKAAERIEKEDDIPAERKAEILNQLRAKITELRQKG